MEKQDKEKELLLKSISALLDETIEEVERLSKGDVSFSDLKLQPKEQGDMADLAGQGGADALDPMKKEDEEAKEEPKKDEEAMEEPKSEEAAVAAPVGEEKEEDKEEEDKDEDKDDEDEDESPEFKKFEENMIKVLVKLNVLPAVAPEAITKSEDVAEPKVEEDLLAKAQDEKIERLEKVIEGLTKSVEDLSKRPVARKSVSGLKPIMKSDDSIEQPQMKKGEVLDKLIEAQRSGDKRVNPVLVAKFEQSGNMDLVKGIIS